MRFLSSEDFHQAAILILKNKKKKTTPFEAILD